MGKERHRLPDNKIAKIGIYSDEPQWGWWISEETFSEESRYSMFCFSSTIKCCVNTQSIIIIITAVLVRIVQ